MKKLFKKSFNILGVKYRLKMNEMIDEGGFDGNKHILYVEKNMNEEKQIKALLHELLHAAFYEAKIDTDLNNLEHPVIAHVEEIVYKHFIKPLKVRYEKNN